MQNKGMAVNKMWLDRAAFFEKYYEQVFNVDGSPRCTYGKVRSELVQEMVLGTSPYRSLL